MVYRNASLAAAILLSVAATPHFAQSDTSAPAPSIPPAGTYTTDPAHTRVSISLDHLGFSTYTFYFRKFEGTLIFDPDKPETMQLTASVDPASVETLYPDATYDFNGVISGEQFLDARKFPELTFKSTRVRLTAPHEAAVTGDLTLHGITRPVTLHVRYNGGYAGNPLDPGGARIGFSAEGAIFRSDFGMGFGIPAPGTTMGVGDLVALHIETELNNPDAPGVQVGP